MSKKTIVKSDALIENATGERSGLYTSLKLDSDFELIEKLERCLAPVEGQDFACQAVKQYLFGVDGRENPKGPSAILTFAGAPAVGKTFMAELIAKAMGRPFLRLDMSSFSEHEISVCDLFGIHASYKSAKSGMLTAYVKNNPVCVLLLDEFEKAHFEVQSCFLQVFENGEALDLYTNKNISFRDAVIIVTTNLGREIYSSGLNSYNLSQTPQSTILRAFKNEINPRTRAPFFSEAMVSRLSSGRIIMFNKLRPEIINKIIEEEVRRCIDYYRDKYGIKIAANLKQLSMLLILSQGESADIRAVIKAVGEFFEKNVERLVKANREADAGAFHTVECEIDFGGMDGETQALFNGGKARLLVCCAPSRKEFFAGLKDVEVIFADNGEKISLDSADVSCAVIDKNEELEKYGRKLFDSLMAHNEIPVYVYDESARSDVDLYYYTDHGATDTFNSGNLEEWVLGITDGLKLSSVAQALYRANKIVSFDTQYKFDDCKAVLGIGGIRIEIAKDAGDESTFVAARYIPDVRFDDVFGANDAKQEMKKVVMALKNSRQYIRMGIKLPRGILLDGAPGTGKTMLAKALAGEAGLPFIQKNAAEFLNKYVGEGAKSIRETFALARRYAPCILFIDELDAIAKSREDTDKVGIAESLNALLSEMDGFSDNLHSPVFLIAATNFDTDKGETVLDEALLRRFDRKIHIELPDYETRKAYLRSELSGFKCKVTDKMIESIVKRSPGWSPAELHLVVQNALRAAIKSDFEYELTDEILNEAFELYENGENKHYDEEKMKKTAIHEAGHAVIAHLLDMTPVFTTIGARANYGGYISINNEGLTEYSRKLILDTVCIKMAGRASEEAFYGEEGITSGASSDIRSATELATRYFCDYAMDDDIPIFIDKSQKNDELTKKIIALIKEQKERAKELVQNNKQAIRKVADALLARISLDEVDLKEILKRRA